MPIARLPRSATYEAEVRRSFLVRGLLRMGSISIIVRFGNWRESDEGSNRHNRSEWPHRPAVDYQDGVQLQRPGAGAVGKSGANARKDPGRRGPYR